VRERETTDRDREKIKRRGEKAPEMVGNFNEGPMITSSEARRGWRHFLMFL
jgi:hypothetical protein